MQKPHLASEMGADLHRRQQLTDCGTRTRFFHAVADAQLSRILKVDLDAGLFGYEVDQAVLVRAEAMDGTLLLA